VRVHILIPRRKPKKLVSRHRSKRSRQVAAIIMLTALFGSFYALLGESGLMAVMKMRSRATQLRYEINGKERANREVLDIIKPLRDEDPDAIEKLAREKLFMARPGDTIYVLPPESSPIEPARSQPGSPTSPSAPSRR
jgi:cell division protein FtsB